MQIVKGFGLVKAMVFPVVMYGCESWTVKKAECGRTDAFELWCWRRLLRVPWTVAHQVPSSMGFSRQEYWGGLPFLDWMKHKLESRLLGEISIISDMQMTPHLWQKAKKN